MTILASPLRDKKNEVLTPLFEVQPLAKPHSFERPHMVMIEDNPDDVGLLMLALDEVGIASIMHHVSNANQTYALMRELGALPSLIILDLNLPISSGDHILQHIKQASVWMKVPLVIFSSSRLESDIEKCFDLGADAFKTKPSTYEGFMDFARSLRPYLRQTD